MTAQPASGASLDKPDLARLWGAARGRLERNGRSVERARIELDGLDDGELAAICGILGRRRPGSPRMRVGLADLDTALARAGHAGGLIGTLERIGGPVVDRRALRAADEEARAALWDAAATHPATGIDGVEAWLASLRQRGRVTRFGSEDPIGLVTAALDAIEHLTTRVGTRPDGPVPLPIVAASYLGDAHALDPESHLGALVVDAMRHLSGMNDDRAAWSSFGVQLDQVNTTALTYRLPGEPGSIVAAACAGAEPLRLTHRMLDNGAGLDLEGTAEVWVCENPAVLTVAAERLGPTCPPMICTEGMPASVTGRLLGILRCAGSALRVHADLDVGGMAITNHIVATYEAVPWRMTVHDYLAAIAGPTTALVGTVGATPWDPDLAVAMNRHRRGIHEEALIATLLDDLGSR